MPLKITLTIADSDLKHFRREIRKAQACSRKIADEIIIGEASGMVESMRGTSKPECVRVRVEQLEALVSMLTDERWALPGSIRRKILGALAYFVNPQDMIPDDTPALGFLDDAIMIELIARELKHDIEAYQDFVAFGRKHKERPGIDKESVIDSQEFKRTRDRLRSRARRRSRTDRGNRAAGGRLF